MFENIFIYFFFSFESNIFWSLGDNLSIVNRFFDVLKLNLMKFNLE